MRQNILLKFAAVAILCAAEYYAVTHHSGRYVVVNPFALYHIELRNLQVQQMIKEGAISDEKQGVMRASDSLRVGNIDIHHASISDSDLDFLMNLKDHPLVPTKHNARVLLSDVLGCLAFVTSYTPAQSSRVFNTAVPLLKSNYSGARAGAADVLDNLGDTRAIPALRPLLHDPDPGVVDRAREAIADLSDLNA